MTTQADILTATRRQAMIDRLMVITREQRDDLLIHAGPSEAEYRERIAAEASEEAAMLWGLGWRPPYRYARRTRRSVRRACESELIGTGSVAERSL